MTGEMFGRYRLDALIGRGGMGEVFRATDTTKDRIVAIKRLPPGMSENTEFRSRFQAEATLAARLHEPHIIPIHDFGEIDGRLFIDMRLVEGRDLGQIIAAEGALPPDRVVNIVAQIALALDVAHAEGLVHRDIKPGNVLVTRGSAGVRRTGGAVRDEFVYVADFGIARNVTSASPALTATGATIGSLEYMAPERFGPERGDCRSDVYSLGCLLFEGLTGRRPFDVEGAPALINAHLNMPPPKPSERVSGLPAGLDPVVARAMHKDPSRRYQSAGALAAAAWAASEGEDHEAAAEKPFSWADQLAVSPSVAEGAASSWPSAEDRESSSVPKSSASAQFWRDRATGSTTPPTAAPPAVADRTPHVPAVGFVSPTFTPPIGSPPPTALSPSSVFSPASVSQASTGMSSPWSAQSAGSSWVSEQPPPAGGWSPENILRPAGRPRGRRGGAALVAAIGFVVAGLCAVAWYFGIFDRQNASEIRTEPIMSAGENPFMPSQGVDRADVASPVQSGGSFTGDTPGLFGGTGNDATCNRGGMIQFLQANPNKRAAWADVQGITPEEVPEYIGRLTPALLRSDTAVTNHGWRRGRATTVKSVLQAGTAVLVDEFGQPRARCSCGNPLTPSLRVDSPQYTGPSWEGFDTQKVATIQPAPSAVTQFTMVNVLNNAVFYRPVATDGSSDRPQSSPTPSVEYTPVAPIIEVPPPPATAPPPRPAPSIPQPQPQPQPDDEDTVDPPDPPAVSGKRVTVYGSRKWTDTGIDIEAGDQVEISARGSINVFNGQSDWNKSPSGGPSCTSSDSKNSGEWTANGFPCWSLLGRVSGGIFLIGSSKSFEAETSGTLKLGVNDESSASFNDNSGSWQVDVTVTKSR